MNGSLINIFSLSTVSVTTLEESFSDSLEDKKLSIHWSITLWGKPLRVRQVLMKSNSFLIRCQPVQMLYALHSNDLTRPIL